MNDCVWSTVNSCKDEAVYCARKLPSSLELSSSPSLEEVIMLCEWVCFNPKFYIYALTFLITVLSKQNLLKNAKFRISKNRSGPRISRVKYLQLLKGLTATKRKNSYPNFFFICLDLIIYLIVMIYCFPNILRTNRGIDFIPFQS